MLFEAVRQRGGGVLHKFVLLSVLHDQSIFFPRSHSNGSEITGCMIRMNRVLRGVAVVLRDGVKVSTISMYQPPDPAVSGNASNSTAATAIKQRGLFFFVVVCFVAYLFNLSPLHALTCVNIVTSSICSQNNVA